MSYVLPFLLGGLAGIATIRVIARLRVPRAGLPPAPAVQDPSFQAAFDQAAVGIAYLDPEGRWLRVNDRYCEILGYPREELLLRHARELNHPNDLAIVDTLQDRLLSGETGLASIEMRYIRKDGGAVWVNAARSIVRAEDGTPEFIVSVVEDVSARHRAESRLSYGKAQYRAIFDRALEAMAVIDAEGTIQSVNPALQRMFGYAAAELIGRNVRMLMPEAESATHDDYLARYRETGQRRIIGIGREVEGRRKDGTVFPLDLSVAEWQQHDRTFFTGIMRDISARKDAEAALRRSEERLRVLQNEFAHLARVTDLGEMAAAIAHEINQPLAAIVNYLNAGLLLARRGLDEEVFAGITQDMEAAAEQALRAGDIVRRLREFVGQGSGARTVEDAEQLTDSAMALALIDARSAGIEVEKIVETSGTQIEVDAVQVNQVLVNLLRNAVEAMTAAPLTRPRQLTVTVREACEAQMVELAIADTGPGIDPAIEGRLFEPFVTSKSKGMGMGLSVCRRLVEAHGGQVEVDNRPGEGATFRIRLPRFEPDVKDRSTFH